MRRRILLLGASLTLQSVGALLAAMPEFEISHAVELPPDGWVPGPAPHAVVFDLGEGPPDCALAHLVAHAGLILVGVDFEDRHMFLFSCVRTPLNTRDDLLKILAGQSAGSLE